MYIELHAASAFSFLQGASLPETLVERAATLGYPAMALLDADGVYGAPRFHKAATKAGLRAIIGAELTIEATGGAARTAAAPLAAAGAGGLGRGLPQPVPPGHEDEAARRQGRGRAPDRGAGRLTPRGWWRLPGRALLDAQHYGVGGLLDRLVGIFGRGHVYVDVQRHLLRDEESDNTALSQLAQAFKRAGGRHQRRALRRAGRAASCSTCSPASTTAPRWTPPAASWRATPSAT